MPLAPCLLFALPIICRCHYPGQITPPLLIFQLSHYADSAITLAEFHHAADTDIRLMLISFRCFISVFTY